MSNTEKVEKSPVKSQKMLICMAAIKRYAFDTLCKQISPCANKCGKYPKGIIDATLFAIGLYFEQLLCEVAVHTISPAFLPNFLKGKQIVYLILFVFLYLCTIKQFFLCKYLRCDAVMM